MERATTLAPRHPSGWTVEEYYQLLECGALGEDDHVELLGGAIVAGEPQSPKHATTISRLQRLLDRRLGDRAIVRAQRDCIAGHRSAPEPDLAIVPLVDDWYATAHPSRAHAVFEVAVASLLHDRLTKGPIYAGNGVPQYVLANLRDRCVENHARPDAQRGRYAVCTVLPRGDTLRLVGFSDVELAVDGLLARHVRV
jgi:Uma2 family endonuclease